MSSSTVRSYTNNNNNILALILAFDNNYNACEYSEHIFKFKSQTRIECYKVMVKQKNWHKIHLKFDNRIKFHKIFNGILYVQNSKKLIMQEKKRASKNMYWL